jgi:alcohol dehydrogenase, propanol-preferring
VLRSPGSGGGLGHLALQIGARGMGLRMIGIDHGSKEKLSKECGAEAFFDVTKYSGQDGDKKLAEDVKAATGGLGAASVVVCTASNKAYGQALSFLKFRGSVVCVGVPVRTFSDASSVQVCANTSSGRRPSAYRRL